MAGLAGLGLRAKENTFAMVNLYRKENAQADRIESIGKRILRMILFPVVIILKGEIYLRNLIDKNGNRIYLTLSILACYNKRKIFRRNQ